ncbi:MAG: Mov34/MPN/PAD-1 family protein [Deltaproteobacteria bacterium]|nr:Mov34/MPN/PAD-1 family protein [Deltaproteobacteria bacterium]
MTIPRAVLDEIEQASREAYAGGLEKDGAREGEEACGVIVGPAGDLQADAQERLPNLANRYHAMDPEGYPRTGRTYFLVDPLKFSKKVREAEAAGRPVKVLWHSHLDCGAYFSDTDAQTALAGGDEPSYDLAFLVVSVRGDGRGGGATVDDRKLFVWDAAKKAFVEGALRIA